MYRQSVHDTWEERLRVYELNSTLSPYATERSYIDELLMREKVHEFTRQSRRGREHKVWLEGGYGSDLMSEVFRYAQAAAALALNERFDVIHAHDWMAYPAGMLIKRLTGRPLVCHIHAMEFDRSGHNMNRAVASIEKAGLEEADRIVAVSYYTRNQVMSLYGIPGEKIEVVHNAVNRSEAEHLYKTAQQEKKEKIVLFMGRVTFQKGPDYFIDAADMVLKIMPDVRFIMAGNGDMLNRMVRRAAQLRIGSRIHFTGFLRGADVDRMYALSDLYVMPSVSEPFGIAPLEAMIYDVPVLMSRQSGVSEVIRNALKVDFWDVREMANKI
jgi:glycosyltransferase involved in cell wall biosynthesis